MANKPLKSIKFPGLSDTYTVPQFDSATGGMGTAGKIPDSKAVKDAVDSLKEDLTEVYSWVEAPYITGYFITLSGGVGSTIDLTSPSANTSRAYTLAKCKSGDKFRVTATGGAGARAWAFLDESYKIVSVASSGANVSNEELIAPTDGYFISNAYSIDAYKTEKYTPSNNYPLKHEITSFTDDYYINTSGSIGSTVNMTPVYNGSFSYQIVPCSEGDVFIVTAQGGASSRAWAFVDENYKLILQASSGYVATNLSVLSPAHGYLIVNAYKSAERAIYTHLAREDALDWINDVIDAEPWTQHPWEFVLPDVIRVCEDIEFSMYSNNFMRYVDTRKLDCVYPTNPKISYFDDFGRYTGLSGQARFTSQIKIFGDNTKDFAIVSKYFAIDTIAKSAGSGETKKILLIGDSLTDADATSGELITMFANDAMGIELIGTLGTAPNLNEGRAGWRAYTYAKCSQGSDDTAGLNYTNPFYNPSTQEFDFGYYMTQNGFSGVDYVFICLGTNDVAKADHSTDEEILSYYNIMINSIKAYNSNIKIGLWLPPTRALYANCNRMQIDTSLRMNKLLIDTYSAQEANNIYIVPVYLNIDPYHDYTSSAVSVSSRNTSYTMTVTNDPVHPSEIGYKKIADVIYSYIKFFAT